MAKRKVVLTGACGHVSGRMLNALRERYDLTMIDIKTTSAGGTEVNEVEVVDLLNRDRDAYRALFKGADAVVHSGFKGTVSHRHTDFWKEHENVMMCYNVYQTCLEEGVRRVVTMSSNHAADFYEPLMWEDRIETVRTTDYPLTDNFYGWGKISYEALGFVFATGSMNKGEQLEGVMIRIGAPRETDFDDPPKDLKKLHRSQGAYFSARDQVQLVTKSIETADITDEFGVPFQIFYGISNNTHRFWEIANARRIVGYAPEDDSAVMFASKVGTVMKAAQKRNYGKT